MYITVRMGITPNWECLLTPASLAHIKIRSELQQATIANKISMQVCLIAAHQAFCAGFPKLLSEVWEPLSQVLASTSAGGRQLECVSSANGR